jgi:hypothetical protein
MTSTAAGTAAAALVWPAPAGNVLLVCWAARHVCPKSLPPKQQDMPAQPQARDLVCVGLLLLSTLSCCVGVFFGALDVTRYPLPPQPCVTHVLSCFLACMRRTELAPPPAQPIRQRPSTWPVCLSATGIGRLAAKLLPILRGMLRGCRRGPRRLQLANWSCTRRSVARCLRLLMFCHARLRQCNRWNCHAPNAFRSTSSGQDAAQSPVAPPSPPASLLPPAPQLASADAACASRLDSSAATAAL